MHKKIIFALVILLSQYAFAGDNFCKKSIPGIIELYQELLSENTLACIYSTKKNKEYATIEFIQLTGNDLKTIGLNDKYITLENMTSSPPFLELTHEGQYQITRSFPRDTYVVVLRKQDEQIKPHEIYRSIKLNGDSSTPPSLLSISLSPEALQEISFRELTQANAFDKTNSVLSPSSIGQIAFITGKKSYLYNTPNEEGKTRSHLIQGDSIELLAFKDRWLLIKYQGKRKAISKWIKLSDIL